jgi:hypothetical protein
MARRRRGRDPAAEKAQSYRKDSRIADEYPQLFRRAWPQKKALRNQTYRRQLQRSLTHALATADDPADVAPAPVRRVLSKWTRTGGAIPLGEWVRWKRATRLHRIAWNFFKEPYDGQCHRLPFVRFLGQAPMDQPGDFSRFYVIGGDAPTWLRRFFRDEPAWEPRLRGWIAALHRDDRPDRRPGDEAPGDSATGGRSTHRVSR